MPGMPETQHDLQEQLRIARQAEAAFDWRAAIAAYEDALSSLAGDTERAPDEAALLTALGRCYWNISEARTAWRTLRRAISLCQQNDDAIGQAAATLEITRIWGPPDRHRQMIDEALDALGDRDAASRARLLLRYRWSDDVAEARWDEAIAIAEKLQLEDVLAFRTHREAWQAMDAGRVDDAVALFERAHASCAAHGVHDQAAAMLRNIGFQLIEKGDLDRGYAYAERCFDYASRTGMLFSAQLALMDMAAVLYGRGEFERCEALLDRSPGETDFRGDLYRMWIAEARGDVDGALRLMVSPERSGNSPTASGQIHAAAAGLLYRAGRIDAAAQALRAWRDVERGPEDFDFPCFEGAALTECILALGDEALWRQTLDAFARYDERFALPLRFSTLQGHAVAPLRGGVAARLGLRDEAERVFREGLAWCEQAGCARGADACRDGLRALGVS
jgi:tetratricopeptide (TPR) repeat protein